MTLILRGGAYGESLEASLAPFEAEHNVDIEVMLMSFDDLHTGIALDAVNEVGTYDLCMVDGSWMAEFTENNVLANLSEMGYSFDDDIIPATTTICKVGEDIYLAPYYGNVTVMMYNKQLLADAGYAPEDIDSFADLMDIAQKTKAADSNKNGFLIRGGSAACNVMPQDMTAVINFRLADGDTVESVMAHCREAVQDKGVEMRFLQANDPSAIARRDGYGYRTVVESFQRYYPEAVFIPSMAVGATDAHRYEEICDTCLRCSPFMTEPAEAASGVHGTNERLLVRSYLQGIRVLIDLMEHANVEP